MPQIEQDIVIEASPEEVWAGSVHESRMIDPQLRECRRPATGTGARGKLLHRSLTANAVFSGASGALLAVASRPVAEFLGWTNRSAPQVLLGIGVALLAFAAVLAFAARAPHPNETVVRTIVALDVTWVLGSALLLALGFAPSGRGVAVIGGVAAVVALLAVGQAVGLTRAVESLHRPTDALGSGPR